MGIRKHHYIESGLTNVYISGLSLRDDLGEQCLLIPSLGQLHKLIARSLIFKEGKLDDSEIYFLRGEMGMSEGGLLELFNSKNFQDDFTQLFQSNIEFEVQFRKLAFERLLSDSVDNDWKELIVSEAQQDDIHIQAPSKESSTYTIIDANVA